MEILRRDAGGPLSSHIDRFSASLLEQGYTKCTIKNKTRLILDLGRWLHRSQLQVSALDEQVIAQFLRYRRGQGRNGHGNPVTLRALLGHLRDTGVVPAPVDTIDDSPLANITRRFAEHLARERGLAQVTSIKYLRLARRFLFQHFGAHSIELGNLSPMGIRRFMLQYARRMSPVSSRQMIKALRIFFRFLRQRGEIPMDLVASIPRVANWRLSTLPRSITHEEVERLLKTCDQSTPVGRRDYAILLLLARLGLRGGEIISMSLDDIDWDAGELVVRGKGPQLDRLPIPEDVGRALVAYLRKARPSCPTRRIFICMPPPRRGFASSNGISKIVHQALARAGLNPPHKGAHLLRHSLATRMLRKGASLTEIGQILRHRDINTTTIYAKVDLLGLRSMAHPWPSSNI